MKNQPGNIRKLIAIGVVVIGGVSILIAAVYHYKQFWHIKGEYPMNGRDTVFTEYSMDGKDTIFREHAMIGKDTVLTVTHSSKDHAHIHFQSGDSTDRAFDSVNTFHFSRKTVGGALHDIAVWYGVKMVVVEKGVDTSTMVGNYGEMVKSDYLGDVLKNFEQKNRHLILRNDTIFVKPNF
jgi:hypothetical protein